MNAIHRVIVIVLILILILFVSGWKNLNGDVAAYRHGFQSAPLPDKAVAMDPAVYYIQPGWSEDLGGSND